MIKVLRFLALCMIGVALASSVAWAQTYKPVDVPYSGAVLTGILGGPNLEGTSVGIWVDAVGIHGFSLTARDAFTSFDAPSSEFTVPLGLNLQGVIVGLYLDSGSVSHGFILSGGKYTLVNVPGAAGTALSSINDLGEISGFTCSDPACGETGLSTNVTHSFVMSAKGVFTFFDPPGATSSAAETVSLLGAVVGNYTDTKGELNHGYLLFLRKYTTIDFPGATGGTSLSGGNVENDIVGIYNETSPASTCAAGCEHSFLLHNGVFKSFDYPEVGVQDTYANGINALGEIVGSFLDSSGNEHGFIRTP
jgi:uncharacterized membrane protein